MKERHRQPSQGSPVDLLQFRSEINSLDTTIAALLTQRLALSRRIGAIKAKAGIAVKNNQREQEVLANVARAANDEQIAHCLSNIYKGIIDESCRLQKELPKKSATTKTPLAANSYFPRVLLVGLGAIGGAIAYQIRRKMPGTHLSAIDQPKILTSGLERGIIDCCESDLKAAVAKAGLILLCASPDENMRLLKQIAPLTKRRQVVVDVTSTKQAICHLSEELELKADFVGGHPLFGSHLSGLPAAATITIDGQRFCLSATKRTSDLTLRRLSRFLQDLGLVVVRVPAKLHDETLALTSHSVQLLAVALGCCLTKGRSDDQLRQTVALSGPSLQSLSRLMASPAGMWTEIIAQNKTAVASALADLSAQLRSMRLEVLDGKEAKLKERFSEAARFQTALLELQKDKPL